MNTFKLMTAIGGVLWVTLTLHTQKGAFAPYLSKKSLELQPYNSRETLRLREKCDFFDINLAASKKCVQEKSLIICMHF